jgi:glycosyl transferase family 25
MRWKRMAGLLAGLNFKRLPAVDGKTLDGPEFNAPDRIICHETLSRYNRACILSHRAAYQEFLAGPDPYGCVLEDDVFLSPDFSRFMNRTDWIPADCHLVKFETTQQEIYTGTPTIRCLDRVAQPLRSLNFGAAGYMFSRRGAQVLLEMTVHPDRAIDRILFDEEGLKRLPSVQLIPALCIQASHRGGELLFSEMQSTLQPKIEPPPVLRRPPVRQPRLDKIRRELFRPFRQLAGRFATWDLSWRGLRRLRVPFI